MRNHEITVRTPLLNRDGSLCEPGYAKTPLFDYNREFLPAGKLRMKEWDYYLIMTQKWGAAFTISDLGYVQMVSASFLDFENSFEVTNTALGAPSLKYQMPVSSQTGSVHFSNKDVNLRFESAPGGRHIYCLWKNFYHTSDLKCDVWFENLPEESMTIATPFANKKYFYLNQKINCMPASGKIVFDWHVHHLDPQKDSGILDWGRGYWPYKVHWYWGTGSTMIKNKPFGFNLGYGFGDTSAASENMLFYQGKAHKLDDVSFEIPRDDPMKPWQITSSDGRFEGIFTPDLDRAAKIDIGPIHTDQHQYFGLFSGTAILDNGQKLSIQQMRCAFESVENRY